MQLDPKHLTLNGLLTGRLFRIPEYQRSYAWGTKQRADLFSDIREVHSSGQHHFMATVVCLDVSTDRIGTTDYKSVDVVDGQQRLTTLIVLLKAIETALAGSKTKADKETRSELTKLLVKGNSHSLILLQTNHDSSSIFTDYLRKGKFKEPKKLTAADKNIIDAISECETFVGNWCEMEEVNELVAILKNSLSVVYHELNDEAAVYRVFEVLNSRGLEVKWIDKLKSQLMGLIFEHAEDGTRSETLKEMRVIWQNIYRTLGLRGGLGDDALRFAGTLWSDDQPNRLLSQEKAAELLAECAGEDVSSIIEVARWLQAVVEAVDEIDQNSRLNAVTKIVHARFLAVSIILRELKPKQTKELLGIWEKITFRIYGIARKDSRYKVGEYVRAAYDIYEEETSTGDIDDTLTQLGADFSIDAVMAEADWKNCYEGWGEELRYLLFRFDEHLAEEAGEKISSAQWTKVWAVDPSKSIEHICPQSTKRSYIHDIGNLTMLPPGINSKLQDKPPVDKTDAYESCGLRGTADVGRIIKKKQKWGQKQIESRRKMIIGFVESEWS